MFKKNVLFLIFMSVMLTIPVSAAADNTTEFWQALTLDAPIGSDFKFYFEKQIRFEEKLSNLDTDFTELGVRYKLNKYLNFRLNYRYVSISGSEIRHRFDGNAQLNFRLFNFTASNRFRIQNESIEDFDGMYSELEFRDRLRFSFNLSKKVKPYFGGEIFLGLGEDGDTRNKYRLTVGTEWKLKKKVSLKFFYHFQKELQEINPDSFHIFGIKFNYSF